MVYRTGSNSRAKSSELRCNGWRDLLTVHDEECPYNVTGEERIGIPGIAEGKASMSERNSEPVRGSSEKRISR